MPKDDHYDFKYWQGMATEGFGWGAARDTQNIIVREVLSGRPA
jgi:hypothetical protein